jgi:hypothetical protein
MKLKMQRKNPEKNLDLIVLNSLLQDKAGFVG